MSATAIAETRSDLTLPQVLSIARDNVVLFADMPLDQIVSCKRAGDEWRVEIDLVEAPARLGDNDLIATFAMTISSDGDVQGIERMRRYTRDNLEATGR